MRLAEPPEPFDLVRAAGIAGQPSLAVVAIPATAVLIRDRAPAPVSERIVGHDAEFLLWFDAPRSDGAQVGPVVADIERVQELLARVQARSVRPPVVE